MPNLTRRPYRPFRGSRLAVSPLPSAAAAPEQAPFAHAWNCYKDPGTSQFVSAWKTCLACGATVNFNSPQWTEAQTAACPVANS